MLGSNSGDVETWNIIIPMVAVILRFVVLWTGLED